MMSRIDGVNAILSQLMRGDRVCENTAFTDRSLLDLALRQLRDIGYEIVEEKCGAITYGNGICDDRAYWVPAVRLAQALEGKTRNK
jgi:hypothetical protein